MPISDDIEEPSAIGLYPWLLIGFQPVLDLFHGDYRPIWPAAAGLAVFVAFYLRVLWLGLRRTASRPWTEFAVLTVVTFALCGSYGGSMFALTPLLSIVWGGILPWDRRPLAPWGVAVLALLVAGLALLKGGSGGNVLDLVWNVGLAGFVTALVFHLINVIGEWRETREELAATAVENERLRFSRDLHDLLGHTLSVMVVKAQAIRRVSGDPGIVTEQAKDIEEIGREALAQVRQAVTGYRGRGLTAELDAARHALADFGISATVRLAGAPVSPDADYLFGWVVREAVTNVIRHSEATACEIMVDPGEVVVADDGKGGDPSPGNGLRGLTERVQTLGGELTCGPRDGGGFRLAARLPE